MPAEPFPLLKVLLIHNHYRSSAPSGEDAVFENERALLQGLGYRTVSYEKRNDDIDDSSRFTHLSAGIQAIWSRQTYRELVTLLQRERPDLAHFHNTFPLVSPSAYAACRQFGIPVVQTLHNYRLVCPNGLLVRDGRPCERCVGRYPWPAIRFSCYRGSAAASAAVATMLTVNRIRKVYSRLVDRYIALTKFAAGLLRVGGLPGERIVVKPNFLPERPRDENNGRENKAVYVGRLSHEKGLRTLIEAWEILGSNAVPLEVIGEGPLHAPLRAYAGDRKLPVAFLGPRSRKEVLRRVRTARVQIVPSQWYEGFPMVILEAYACGTPVIASRIGSLKEIVQHNRTGLLFEAGEPRQLAACLQSALSGGRDRELGKAASALFDAEYTAERNGSMLTEIYRNVCSEAASANRSG